MTVSCIDAPLGAAAAALRRGAVIAVPTDTVFGLACEPHDPAAVERVYRIKRRPAGLELTLLAAEPVDLDALVDLSGAAMRLAERFWPGALSLIVPVAGRRLAVPLQGETLSVRVPAHERLAQLLRRTGPLATTSANRHGEPPALSAEEVRLRLGDELGAVLDGRPGGGVPSTIIDCASAPPRIVREGAISSAELRPYLEGPWPRCQTSP